MKPGQKVETTAGTIAAMSDEQFHSLRAREAQQQAALAGHNRSPVQLSMGCDHEWEYNYNERTCIRCFTMEICED